MTVLVKQEMNSMMLMFLLARSWVMKATKPGVVSTYFGLVRMSATRSLVTSVSALSSPFISV